MTQELNIIVQRTLAKRGCCCARLPDRLTDGPGLNLSGGPLGTSANLPFKGGQGLGINFPSTLNRAIIFHRSFS